jgi:hypothetical protein
MRWRALLLVGCLACNRTFGIENTDLRPADDGSLGPDADPRADLDRDGIKDLQDSCIAPDTDLLIDSDGDGVPNGQDACPFVFAATPDSDGDGIGDACDPFPALAGDRIRCLMAFSDPELDIHMWLSREDPASWVFYQPRAMVSFAPGTLVADWPFEAPAPLITTYQAVVASYSPFGAVSLLVRAATPSPDGDVGCIAEPGDVFAAPAAISSPWSLSTTSGTSVLTTFRPSGVTAAYQLTATMVPSRDGITTHCQLRFETGEAVALDEVLPTSLGNMGLASVAHSQVRGLVVYERDDAPM